MLRKVIIAITAFLLAFTGSGCSQTEKSTDISVPELSDFSNDSVTNNNYSIASNNPYGSKNSSRYTHLQSTDVVGNNLTTEGFELIAQNEKLALYFRKKTASIRVVNLENGYIWGCLANDKPDNLNQAWSSFGNSLVSIEYSDSTGTLRKIGAGHSDCECEFTFSENGVSCKVLFEEIGISLTAVCLLTDEGIQFSVDDKTICEEDEYKLCNLYFAPFFGAVRENEISGYIVIPDGCGALIRFNRSQKYNSGYNAKVFGADGAIDTLEAADNLSANHPDYYATKENTASIPLYGIVHGVRQNAFFAHIDNGAEYAVVSAVPAGFSTDYNWGSFYYVYRQAYVQPVAKSGAGVKMLQKVRNSVNPKVTYRFLDGNDADYVGIAKNYRHFLDENKMLPDGYKDNSDLALDFIISDIKEGFLFSTTKSVTTFDDLQYVREFLKKNNISKTNISLIGWQKGGVSGYKKNKIYQSSAIGNFAELKQLKKDLSANQNDLSFYLDCLTGKKNQIAGSDEFAIGLSQSQIKDVGVDSNAFLPDTYYLKFPLAMSLIKKQNEILKNAGFHAVIANGNQLYSEYLEDNSVSRNKAKKIATETFKNISKNQKVTVFNPNEYLFSYVKEYRNIPMSSGQYLFETDSIPLLQIVLSGRMGLYAPYCNESFCSVENILKCIEFNCRPSFLMTGIPNSKLTSTTVAQYSSTYFRDWENKIVSVYHNVNSILSEVDGKNITEHSILQEGVSLIKYSDGYSVLVNYNTVSVYYLGQEIKPQSAVCFLNDRAIAESEVRV